MCDDDVERQRDVLAKIRDFVPDESEGEMEDLDSCGVILRSRKVPEESPSRTNSPYFRLLL